MPGVASRQEMPGLFEHYELDGAHDEMVDATARCVRTISVCMKAAEAAAGSCGAASRWPI